MSNWAIAFDLVVFATSILPCLERIDSVTVFISVVIFSISVFNVSISESITVFLVIAHSFCLNDSCRSKHVSNSDSRVCNSFSKICNCNSLRSNKFLYVSNCCCNLFNWSCLVINSSKSSNFCCTVLILVSILFNICLSASIVFLASIAFCTKTLDVQNWQFGSYSCSERWLIFSCFAFTTPRCFFNDCVYLLI